MATRFSLYASLTVESQRYWTCVPCAVAQEMLKWRGMGGPMSEQVAFSLRASPTDHQVSSQISVGIVYGKGPVIFPREN